MITMSDIKYLRRVAKLVIAKKRKEFRQHSRQYKVIVAIELIAIVLMTATLANILRSPQMRKYRQESEYVRTVEKYAHGNQVGAYDAAAKKHDNHAKTDDHQKAQGTGLGKF